jgi:hypothetical protein
MSNLFAYAHSSGNSSLSSCAGEARAQDTKRSEALLGPAQDTAHWLVTDRVRQAVLVPGGRNLQQYGL